MSVKINKEIIDGIAAAMRAEHEGEHFYHMAASAVSDPKGKEVLSQLADEEREHWEFLKAQYESLTDTGKPDMNRPLAQSLRRTDASPIFSEDIRTRLSTAHYEMTVLAIGVQLELTSMEHYRAMAKQASDPEVAKFFSALADWERGHYRALLAQQDALQRDYWDEAGFAPF
jgi:rubrerythrin